jgi:hypothetical protein
MAADEWDQYAVKPAAAKGGDEWEQYATKPAAQPIQGLAPGQELPGMHAQPKVQMQEALTPSNVVGNLAGGAGSGYVKGINPLNTLKGLASTASDFVSDPTGAQRGTEEIDANINELKHPSHPAPTDVVHNIGEMIGGTAGQATQAAALGGLAKGIGTAAKATAGPIAETALGVRNVDRAFHRSPGRAILEDTSGVRPATVAKSATERLGDFTGQLENKVDASNIPMSLAPARDVVSGDIAKAQAQNAPGTVAQLRPIESHLTRPIEGFKGRVDTSPGFPAAQASSLLDANGKPLPVVYNVKTSDLSRLETNAYDESRFSAAKSAVSPEDLPPVDLTFNKNLGLKGRLTLDDGNHRLAAARSNNFPYVKATLKGASPESLGLATSELPSSVISETQNPRAILDLKRGISNEHITHWRPEVQSGVQTTARQVYGKLNNELEKVRGVAPLNESISDLIPVKNRAAASDLNANVLQRSIGRFARPTGALAGGLTGMVEGGMHGGPLGAIGGLAAGVGLPELLASPTAQMIAARSLYGTGKALASTPAVAGAALVPLITKKEKDKDK